MTRPTRDPHPDQRPDGLQELTRLLDLMASVVARAEEVVVLLHDAHVQHGRHDPREVGGGTPAPPRHRDAVDLWLADAATLAGLACSRHDRVSKELGARVSELVDCISRRLGR